MRSPQKLLLIFGVGLSAASLFASPAQAGAILGPEPFDGPPNRPLTGASVGRHDVASYTIAPLWKATPNIVYSSDGDSVTVATDESGEFKIATPNRREGILVLKADVKVQTADWVGLSFLDSSEGNFFHARNTLMVLLNATGQVQVLANGGQSLRYSSKVALPGWKNHGTHALELRYDRGAGTADVFVNATRVNDEPIQVGTLNSSTFSFVGARVHGSKVSAYSPLVDNFTYSVQ